MELSKEGTGALNYNLKRIRFKPGYKKLWRDVRTTLKTSLNLTIKYQHRLTLYLLKFKKFKTFKIFLRQDLTLFNNLIKSKILPDGHSIFLFVKYGLFYVNGDKCINYKLVLTMKYKV